MAQYVGPSCVLRLFSQLNLRLVFTFDLASGHRATTFVFYFTDNGIVELRGSKSQGTNTMITTPNPEKENGMAQKTKKWQEIKVVSIFLKHPVRVDISR